MKAAWSAIWLLSAGGIIGSSALWGPEGFVVSFMVFTLVVLGPAMLASEMT